MVHLIGYVQKDQNALSHMILCLLNSLMSTSFLKEKIQFFLCLQMLYKIALGVTRGIEYRYHGYDIQIL